MKKNDPFCLFLCSNEPHSSWDKGEASKYDWKKISLPPHDVDNAETRNAYCHYLAEINYQDGQVIKALNR